MFDVEGLAVVGLAHGCVFYVSGDAEELREEIDGLADVAIDEADGCGLVVEAEV